MSCPNAGHCACPEHAPGLLTYAPDPTAFLIALNRTVQEPPKRLQAIPFPEQDNVYSYGDKPQPWHPRPARLAA